MALVNFERLAQSDYVAEQFGARCRPSAGSTPSRCRVRWPMPCSDHDGSNQAKGDAAADRPWRTTKPRSNIGADWQAGKASAEATTDCCKRSVMLHLRKLPKRSWTCSIGEFLRQSIWDGLFEAAGELLMRRPGILSLHGR